MKRPSHTEHGFTLLEVLVALAILAISMGAVIKAAGQGASNIGQLRDQTLASWVAMNEINAILLNRDWPEPGSSRGTAEMANREWHWRLQIGNTSDEDLRRLDIEVRTSRDAAVPLTRLTGFKRRPG